MGGAAYAFFPAGPTTGTGSAYVGSNSGGWSVNVHLDSGSSGVYLYPGVNTEQIDYTITNTGSGDQNLNTVTAAIGTDGTNIKQGGVSVVGCLLSWFTITDPTLTLSPGIGTAIAPGGSATGYVDVAMTNVNSDQSVCANAQPDINVTAST
jgi:hypothetical protein